MKIASVLSNEHSLFEDCYMEYPDDAEHIVLGSIRTWRRPHCEAQRPSLSWRDRLADCGIDREGADRFDVFMRSLSRTMLRPLDMRCLCVRELSSDEAFLLQTIGMVQRDRHEEAARLLDGIAQGKSYGLLRTAQSFGASLLAAGILIPVRMRRFTYVH